MLDEIACRQREIPYSHGQLILELLTFVFCQKESCLAWLGILPLMSQPNT